MAGIEAAVHGVAGVEVWVSGSGMALVVVHVVGRWARTMHGALLGAIRG